MECKPEEVLENLARKKYAPVYFLQGEETYFIDKIADIIESTILKSEEKDFNMSVLYGKDTTMNQILASARRFPVMAEKQIIMVKEAQTLIDFNKEEAQNLLENYLVKPLISTLLVFSYKYKTLDGRKKLSHVIKEKATLVTCNKLQEKLVPDWITDFLKNKNIKIDRNAAILLFDYLGNNLQKIVNETDKIILGAGEGGTITEDMVMRNIGISKEYNVFELNKALQKKDILKANQIIQYFSSNPKNNPDVMTVATLFGFFSKLLLFHSLSDKTENSASVTLGVKPWFVRDYTEAARHYSFHKTIQIIHLLREADVRCKGVNYTESRNGEVLKELVFKILH
ncbi:MAG: DNA polymerase III subunit delta [Bacteroidetes bacterium RIFCSPLOWO2_02_FULL_36_8]|nr:MAG: DNA polymerase III subunit delta [Bacteroidetes bacterium RIFCSPLOWO2_02_FULL_36_8]OFY70122.1 MAG: DNA polymerase III subunit delta [Bacteroidetes bacterium RIFCSPLOWO2_12_FULL_37_12]